MAGLAIARPTVCVSIFKVVESAEAILLEVGRKLYNFRLL
jgi:hypothetical protein